MYIQKIHIQNIRSITNFIWELPAEDKLAGWHVLIGDNGSGKSTVLRCISLGLLSSSQALRLNPNWEEWLHAGTDEGHIDLGFAHSVVLRNPAPKTSEKSWNSLSFLRNYPFSGVVSLAQKYGEKHNVTWEFSAAYGPFRRFSGSDSQMQPLMSNQELVSAHASIFYESIALSSYREWLTNLDYTSLRGDPQQAEAARKLLENIKRFINQDGFLPYNTRFEAIVPSVNGVQVLFVDGDGNKINVEQLGDGFRSILSMTFDLIRQMTIQYDDIDMVFDDADPTIIKAPGVVLIDEVDAHLHPEWQRRIGFWLTAHFPNIQFIVTTHSPLVCQAASNGSIWRLPAPGSGDMGQQVSRDSEDWKRLVYGDILEAYSTDLFGENINRSPEAQAKIERVAVLSGKELDAPLTTEETHELAQLMDELPSTPYKYTLGNDT